MNDVFLILAAFVVLLIIEAILSRRTMKELKRTRILVKKYTSRIEALEGQLAELPHPENLLNALPEEHKKVLSAVVDRANTISNDMKALKDEHHALKATVDRMAQSERWGRALGVVQREKKEG